MHEIRGTKTQAKWESWGTPVRWFVAAILWGLVPAVGFAQSAFRFEVTTTNVFSPGDTIVPTSANSPATEGAAKAIDGSSATKYLNFDKLNTGFTVTPKMGATVVNQITFTAANDAPERDPRDFILYGSNDGITFESILSGSTYIFTLPRLGSRTVDFNNARRF